MILVYSASADEKLYLQFLSLKLCVTELNSFPSSVPGIYECNSGPSIKVKLLEAFDDGAVFRGKHFTGSDSSDSVLKSLMIWAPVLV